MVTKSTFLQGHLSLHTKILQIRLWVELMRTEHKKGPKTLNDQDKFCKTECSGIPQTGAVLNGNTSWVCPQTKYCRYIFSITHILKHRKFKNYT